jgi:hypothetical protein
MYKIKLIKTFFPYGGIVIVNSRNKIIASLRLARSLKSLTIYAKVNINDKFLSLKTFR